ncbi:ExbD/TolR family protein [Spirochaeta dissipatitropha]
MKIEIRRRRRGFAPAAMADIAFLLLIFLITTTSIDTELDLELPEFAYSRQSDFAETLRVRLDADAQLHIENQTAVISRLPQLLRFHSAGSDTIIMLEADKNLPWITVDELIAVISSSGHEQIVLVAETPGGSAMQDKRE